MVEVRIGPPGYYATGNWWFENPSKPLFPQGVDRYLSPEEVAEMYARERKYLEDPKTWQGRVPDRTYCGTYPNQVE